MDRTMNNTSDHRRARGTRPGFFRRCGGFLLPLCAAVAMTWGVLAGGCASQEEPSTFEKVFNGGNVKPSQLQSRLMALADEVIARISESAGNVEREAEELETRRLA